MSGDYSLENVPVIPAMPSPDGAGGEEQLFSRMAGATIVRIGAPAGSPLEGGGLVIDYRVSGEAELRRVAFAFNENGMWLVYDGLSKV